MHARGFVHCDLKAKHFLMFKGEWKLVDFDNAQPDGASHAACCTLQYAAPEVVVARRNGAPLVASAAIDVWAMAIILCHLFSGRPLHGDDELDGLEERLATRPADVASALERAAGLSDPQRRLLHEMVAVAPNERRGLREVLSKSFFRAGEDTEQAKHVEVLALFSSPTKWGGSSSGEEHAQSAVLVGPRPATTGS